MITKIKGYVCGVYVLARLKINEKECITVLFQKNAFKRLPSCLEDSQQLSSLHTYVSIQKGQPTSLAISCYTLRTANFIGDFQSLSFATQLNCLLSSSGMQIINLEERRNIKGQKQSSIIKETESEKSLKVQKNSTIIDNRQVTMFTMTVPVTMTD